jgi:hypothetical protein
MSKGILPHVGKWTQGPRFPNTTPACSPNCPTPNPTACRFPLPDRRKAATDTPTPDAATILPVGCHVQMSVKISEDRRSSLNARRLTAKHNRAYLVGH